LRHLSLRMNSTRALPIGARAFGMKGSYELPSGGGRSWSSPSECTSLPVKVSNRLSTDRFARQSGTGTNDPDWTSGAPRSDCAFFGPGSDWATQCSGLEVEHESKAGLHSGQSLRWHFPRAFLEVVSVDRHQLCDVRH
jgi:hypothetical protein